MARYAIGDIQGCYTEFQQLLAKINFNRSVDQLYLVGDVINRGPDSLKVLQWICDHEDNIHLVLGNHDIYLMARFNNLFKSDHDDTLDDILTAPNATYLIDYLRRQPLIFQDNNYILVHAGIYPKIKFNTLYELSQEFSQELQHKNYMKFLDKIFTNTPQYWDKKLSYIDKMIFLVNSTTRMRFLDQKTLHLDFEYKGDIFNHPQHVVPWFMVPFENNLQKKIVFGHWAALGFMHNAQVVAVDTGCVWGKCLTAFNLDTFDIYQVKAHTIT